MKTTLLSLSLLALAGCSSSYDSHNDLIGKLVKSEGHSQCVTVHLKPLLDAARVMEVIPNTRDCDAPELARATATGQILRGCPRPVTTVYFGRLSNPALTDSLDQDGWLQGGVPTRIARTATGGYAAFLPQQSAVESLSPGDCNVFDRRIRAGLASHLAYAASLRQQGLN